MAIREIYRGPDFRSGNRGEKEVVGEGDGEEYTPLSQAAAFVRVSEKVMRLVVDDGVSIEVAKTMVNGG